MVALRENEVKALKALEKFGGKADAQNLVKAAQLEDAALMRAALSLSEKGLLTISEAKTMLAKLTDEGREYAKNGLPERRLVKAIVNMGGTASFEEAVENAGLKKEFHSIALGWLKRKNLAKVAKKGDGVVFLEVSQEPPETEDEKLLKKLAAENEVAVNEGDEKTAETLSTLERRNLAVAYERIERHFELTDAGWSTIKSGVEVGADITALTPDIIISGRWRGARFQPYDVKASPPPVYPGKKHPFAEFMEEARRILVSMGFEEAEGPYVETEFWNFDVLFQAQDHPAREIHDSYLVKKPSMGDIEDLGLMERVRQTHENGWKTGSRGWGYKWSGEIAKRLVLRTQTTAVSMRYLSTHKKPPIKMFCLSKVFRPDVLDAKHAMEFIQLDGIVGDARISLRNLFGLLKGFAEAMGLGNVKFKPGYFPFTEPSVESFIKHPKLGWVEFVGAGIFRPEVLKPLGIDFPVIAWGIGFDRLAMIALGVDDIRDLNSRRLDWLRQKPLR